MEAAPGFEPGITVLQTVALPLGYAATLGETLERVDAPDPNASGDEKKNGAGNGVRTRDPNLGKVVLYH